jgi:hypothetical protein
MAPSNNIALIIVIVLVVIGVIILLVVLFNSSKSTSSNNTSSESSIKDDDDSEDDDIPNSGSSISPPNSKAINVPKSNITSDPKLSTTKVTIDPKITNIPTPQLPVPSSHIEQPPAVISVPVSTKISNPQPTLPVISQAQVITAPQVFDSSSSEPVISGNDSLSIIIESGTVSNESAIQMNESDLMISGSASRELSASESSITSSEELDIEKLAEEQGLASVEEISLPSPLESNNDLSDDGSRIVISDLSSKMQYRVPVITDLTLSKSNKSSEITSSEINLSNHNETVGLSVDQSITDPASFSSDFSSQTDKSLKPARSKRRTNPLNDLIKVSQLGKNNPRMGPF